MDIQRRYGLLRRRAGRSLALAGVVGTVACLSAHGFNLQDIALVHGSTRSPAGDSSGSFGTIGLMSAVAVWYIFSMINSKSLQEAECKVLEVAASAPAKKARIDSFDSLRFFLIAYIASGHFIGQATSNTTILRLISQINVVVGGFFVLSGYVAAYTTTELGERKGSKRLDNAVEFAVTRIMGFWPLHAVVLLMFLPMFFWVDATYSGVPTAVWNGFLSVTMLQAWFPLNAEVWNAPTWFLSALSFALCVLPYALRVIATQRKAELRRTLIFLTLLSIIPKLSYSYDLKAFDIMEGMLNAKKHPNYALFNAVRFSPFAALGEVLMGVTACRLVMLDNPKDAGQTGSPAVPLTAMIGVIVLRAAGVIELNDMLIRSVVVMPLWIVFLMRIHRQSVGPGGASMPLPRFLCLSPFLFLGNISFPIFIVHGPVGQMFFKKAVATALFGGSLARPLADGVHWFFGVYWITVLAAALILQKAFVENNRVKEASKNLGAAIIAALT